nr:PREDICTED: uncharacterized protein LOC107076209 [Lepisosteus oculatus]
MKQCNMSATRNIVARTEELLSFSKNLLNYTSESKSIDVKKLYDQRSKMVETNWTRDKGFRKLKSLVEKEDDCEIKSCFIKLCNKSIQICDDLEKAVVPGKMDEQKLKNLLTKIQKLNTKTQEFHIASSQLASTPAISPSAPHVSKTFAGMDESGSLVQSTIQLSQMKIAQSKQQLQQSREEYHKTFENLKKCNQEFDEVLIEMRKLQVDKVDFDTTINMLVKGLDALGRVREQWTKMVQFFQMITNLIDTCLNQNISEFVDSCESVRSIPNYCHLDFIKDMICGPAFQASNVAHLVHMISETYVQVSHLYLMDRMSSLTTLMSLEPNDPKFAQIRRELEAGCKEAQSGIQDLVEKKREEFDASIQKRVDAINKNLESVLPAPSEETSKAIEQCIRKNPVMAIKELSEDDADQFA